MEILSNFSSLYCFISFIIGAMFMFVAFCIAAMGKVQEPMNKVHFYVARDKNSELLLYMGKPSRCNTYFISINSVFMFPCYTFHYFGLNEEDYDNLKWEDEPIEVFIKMEN